MASFLKKVFAPLRQYALLSHDHDERYYTEAEVNALLSNVKAPVNPAQGMPDFLNARTLEDELIDYKTNPIWKCNVPGYLYYWLKYQEGYDLDYIIMAASNVNDLKSGTAAAASNKATILYAQIPDSETNCMPIYPIVPGTSTYFRLMRQEKQKAVLFFVPCVGIKGKVAAANWCVNSGSGTATYKNDQAQAYFFGTTKSAIFDGDWRTLFPSVTW